MAKLYDRIYGAMERHAPPGISLASIQQNFWGSIGLIAVAFFYFLFLLTNDIAYITSNREMVDFMYNFDPAYHMMDSFDFYFRFVFIAFLIGAGAMLICAVFNYGYFYQGSKSIYVMRRLRSVKELHLRCWTVPVWGLVILSALLVLLYSVFLWVYFTFSPEGSIPAQTIAFFWRYVP